MKKHILILTGLLSLPTLSMAATPEPGTFTLTPQVGSYIFEGNQDLDNGVIFGLAPGYFLSRELAIETVVQYVSSETGSATNNEDIDGWLYHVDALYHFFPDNKLVPFIAAGLGGITLDDMPGESNTSLQLNYGVGLKYELTDSLDLRGDVRHLLSFDDRYNNLAALVGLTYSFNAPAKPAPAPRMQETPKPVQPAPAPTPPPIVVKDSDGDGVNDNVDQCPDTPYNVVVDDKGCPVIEKISIKLNIEFDHDKAQIKSSYHDDLQRVADFLKTNPTSKAIIEGHTDNTGGTEYNLELSQKRAEVARQFLIDNFEIDATRLEAQGFGESQPIASNETAIGRQDNRRVVATIKATRMKTDE